MDYVGGLQRLRELLPETALDEYDPLEARLHQNLKQERLYGGDDTTRRERNLIVGGLNELARRFNVGASYNDLCLQRPVGGSSPKAPPAASSGPVYNIHSSGTVIAGDVHAARDFVGHDQHGSGASGQDGGAGGQPGTPLIELEQLVRKLKAVLQDAPRSRHKQAEELEAWADDLLNLAGKETLDKDRLLGCAAALKRSAEELASVAPAIEPLARRIGELGAQLAG